MSKRDAVERRAIVLAILRCAFRTVSALEEGSMFAMILPCSSYCRMI